MLTIFFRAVILYTVSVAAVRLMGKRQIGQLQPYELVLAILIARPGRRPHVRRRNPAGLRPGAHCRAGDHAQRRQPAGHEKPTLSPPAQRHSAGAGAQRQHSIW